jgi:hypothetical protein
MYYYGCTENVSLRMFLGYARSSFRHRKARGKADLREEETVRRWGVDCWSMQPKKEVGHLD